MKAIISSTYDDKYFFFIPIVAWKWNQMGVDVLLFLPKTPIGNYPNYKKLILLDECITKNNLRIYARMFKCREDKAATYSQCARLYASATTWGYNGYEPMEEDEHICMSDVDMYVNTHPFYADKFTIWGSDLVPDGQFPMCYARGTVKEWRELMKIGNKSYQECLDEIIGPIECENIKGNYWSFDQELLWNHTKDYAHLIGRARPGTQFAANRIDRDDIAWRDYLDNFVDAHLWRDGYTDANFSNLMELLTHQYPNESFQWLIDFKNEYTKLL